MAVLRRVGAGVLEGSFGRVSATWPLCVLELGHDALSIRFRPSFLATALGVRPLRVSTHEEALAFPVRGWFASSRFIGIKTSEREGYFRTSNPGDILTSLESAGFQVSWDEHSISRP